MGAFLTLGHFGFNLEEAPIYAGSPKIEGAKEVVTICPFCAVCCQVTASVRDGKLVSTEGDPDFPVNEGSLCAKGAALFSMYTTPHRLTHLPNTNKMRKALDNLDWMVCAELHHSETTDNWRRPGVDPKKIKTEVFLLPSAHRVEKAGTISHGGRWLLWFEKVVQPGGQARDFANMFVPLIDKVRDMYKAEGGALPEALQKMNWPETFDPEEWTRRINGFFWADTWVGDKLYKKGQLVPAFGNLQADGTTSSLNWLYTGSCTEEDGNKSKRRDPSQTPMQAKIGLYPNWSWCWPVNRRILYNRATVDISGKPLNLGKAVIEWDGRKWVGDVSDGP